MRLIAGIPKAGKEYNFGRGVIKHVIAVVKSPFKISIKTEDGSYCFNYDGDRLTPKAIVMDDDYELRSIYKSILEEVSAEVVEVDSTSEARKLIARDHIVMVVTDIEMPKGSGLDFSIWCRETYPEIALALVSGNVELLTIGRHYVDVIVVKPLLLQSIIEVQALLDKALSATRK